MSSPTRSGFHTEFRGLAAFIVDKVVMAARRKMYRIFCSHFPEPRTVVDIGVTSEGVSAPANFFEQWFPHKNRITAVGIEDASHLEIEFPGLKFVQVREDSQLPFDSKQFEVSFSNAVIEHVTNAQGRINFVKEMNRVAGRLFITTPNKYFPIEPHTGIPLLHFLWPKLFYGLLDAGKISKFYSSRNLKLLDQKEFAKIMSDLSIEGEMVKIRTFGFVSNLIFISKDN